MYVGGVREGGRPTPIRGKGEERGITKSVAHDVIGPQAARIVPP